MLPPPVRPDAVLPLPDALVVQVGAGLAPAARQSFCHLSGSARGARAAFVSLRSFVWYVAGGGRELRAGRRAFGVPGMRGIEDGKQRKQ